MSDEKPNPGVQKKSLGDPDEVLSGPELVTPRQRAEQAIADLLPTAEQSVRRVLEFDPVLALDSGAASVLRVQAELAQSVIAAARTLGGETRSSKQANKLIARVGRDALTQEFARRLLAKEQGERAERKRIVQAVAATAEETREERALTLEEPNGTPDAGAK